MRRQDRLWRPVLALLVVLVLPWLVGSTGSNADSRPADAHALAVPHVDQSRGSPALGSQRATALPNVPFATVGLDAVHPAAPAATAPPRFWHAHVAAASPVGASPLAASRGRSPPAAAL